MLPPFGQTRLHHVAGLGPVGADPRKREVTLGQLRAAAVYLVEDVDDDVQRHCLSDKLLLGQVGSSYPQEIAEAIERFFPLFWVRNGPPQRGSNPSRLHQRCHVDP